MFNAEECVLGARNIDSSIVEEKRVLGETDVLVVAGEIYRLFVYQEGKGSFAILQSGPPLDGRLLGPRKDNRLVVVAQTDAKVLILFILKAAKLRDFHLLHILISIIKDGAYY
jgi:hypothetical protein